LLLKAYIELKKERQIRCKGANYRKQYTNTTVRHNWQSNQYTAS